MNTTFVMIALCAGALCLGACDKTPTTPSTSIDNTPGPSASSGTAGPVTDPSLPSAESVLSQASNTKADPTPVRTDGTRKPAQDAATTPMPGQNNDHSAPLSPAKSASAP